MESNHRLLGVGQASSPLDHGTASLRQAAAAGIEPASGRLTAADPYQHGNHRSGEGGSKKSEGRSRTTAFLTSALYLFLRAPSGSRTRTSAMARRQAAATSWAHVSLTPGRARPENASPSRQRRPVHIPRHQSPPSAKAGQELGRPTISANKKARCPMTPGWWILEDHRPERHRRKLPPSQGFIPCAARQQPWLHVRVGRKVDMGPLLQVLLSLTFQAYD